MKTSIILGAFGFFLLVMFPDMPTGGALNWLMGACFFTAVAIVAWKIGEVWSE